MPSLATGLGRTVLSLAAIVATMVSMTAPDASAASPESGKVHFVKEAYAAFDRYTERPSSQQAEWMREHYYRQKTYAPFFDSRLSWFPNGWSYKDLYAIYVDKEVARLHPEWILRDADGRKLYIPWGCENGTCPQYAGDIGNPAFRAHWLAEARKTMAAGYQGLFVDDVNMEFRVGNGQGEQVAPADPRSGQTMSKGTWRRYTAEFVEEIRASFPDVEVAHNPIWYSGHEDPYVRRALMAADYVNLERGVNDDGLTGGGGQWGYETFLAHVDWLHQRGKAVILDSYADDRAGAEYNLASYFLVNRGRDGFRTEYRTVPDDWWTGYDVDLGAAEGRRYEWRGLLRRDFERGYVLVNQPGAPTRTIDLGAGARGPDGAARPTVRLAAAQGAVVVAPGARGAAPGASVFLRRPVPNPRRAAASESARREASTHQGRLRGAVLVQGRIRGSRPAGLKVRVDIRRQAGRRWVHARLVRVSAGSDGSFTKLSTGLRAGRYRARAVVLGPTPRRGASSVRRFLIRR